MRKLMILGIFLFKICLAYGQDFAPIGAKWYFTEGFAFSDNIGFFELSVEKDTIIKGVDCKKIVKNKTQYCSTRPMIEYMYENDANEVYFFDNEIDDFQKLWDFIPNINESWSIEFGADTLITYIVDSISQIEINGLNMKQIHVTYQFHQNGYEYFYTKSTIIEKIGDLNYFFPWNSVVCDENYADGLRCYSDSQIGDYSTGISELCDYTYIGTSIQDYNKNISMVVYPNPTNGLLVLKTDNVSYIDLNYSILDISGRLISAGQVGTDGNFDLSELETGLYQIFIYHGKDIIGIKKVLKN